MNDETGTSALVIREAVEADFAQVAELISATQPEPVTGANVQEWERRVLEGMSRRRMVAVTESGQVVGYGVVQHYRSMGEGRFYLWVTADPNWRRHALKLLAIRYAQEKGASCIVTDNDSQNAPMLAINRKLGYVPRPGIFRLIRQL